MTTYEKANGKKRWSMGCLHFIGYAVLVEEQQRFEDHICAKLGSKVFIHHLNNLFKRRKD